MTFLYLPLSDRIMRGSRGGPTMPARRKTYGADGWLKRQNFVSSLRPHRYDISYGIQHRSDFEEVLSCYHVVNGTPYEGFLFRDPNDHRATTTNSALSLVTGSQYQLRRKYTFGTSVYRDIKCPDEPTVVVFNAGGTPLTLSDIDPETGIVTVSSGTPSYWVGEFFVPVTFEDDAMDTVEIDGLAGDEDTELSGLPSIRLVEVAL